MAQWETEFDIPAVEQTLSPAEQIEVLNRRLAAVNAQLLRYETRLFAYERSMLALRKENDRLEVLYEQAMAGHFEANSEPPSPRLDQLGEPNFVPPTLPPAPEAGDAVAEKDVKEVSDEADDVAAVGATVDSGLNPDLDSSDIEESALPSVSSVESPLPASPAAEEPEPSLAEDVPEPSPTEAEAAEEKETEPTLEETPVWQPRTPLEKLSYELLEQMKRMMEG